MSSDIRVSRVDFADAREQLHAVRETVFIRGQGVPEAIERDGRDAGCRHVLATDADGCAVGTGRIDEHGRIGRMAVLDDCRGMGIGAALLDELVAIGADDGLGQLHLHAQAAAIDFYRQQGWVPVGPMFEEAGIEHRDLRLPLREPLLVTDRDGAQAAVCGLARHARRQLCAFLPNLEPDLFDAAPVQSALRRFATAVRGADIRILLRETAASSNSAPTLALAAPLQRVPAARCRGTGRHRGTLRLAVQRPWRQLGTADGDAPVGRLRTGGAGHGSTPAAALRRGLETCPPGHGIARPGTVKPSPATNV